MCAMLLALACGNTFLDLGDPSPLGSVATLPPDLANVAKQAFYDFGEKPMWTERMTYGASKFSHALSETPILKSFPPKATVQALRYSAGVEKASPSTFHDWFDQCGRLS